jgi:predicted RNA-binding protein YlqC (UPF0109 family)
VEHLLCFIVSSILCLSPSALRLSSLETSTEYSFTLDLAPDQIGIIIGKKGAVIKAIRQLLSPLRSDPRKRIVITIVPTHAEG